MPDEIDVRLTVNDQSYRIRVEPRTTLVDALRENCHLTGTHVGCEHGVCGACTILVDDRAVRSCLIFAYQAEGMSIRTIEGLAPDDSTLHPVQEAFRQAHGLQCGFCTPGFVMTIVDVLSRVDTLDEEQVRAELSGNLCRCTGYQTILAAFELAAATKAAGP
jgi:aerobic carbon-monoxide dehydrogenase small subunit